MSPLPAAAAARPMSKLLTIAALLFPLALTGNAQVQYQPVPQQTGLVIPPNWTQQAIAAQSRSIDFGTVARAAKTEHEFVITNPFNQPMELQSVRASCGCTTPTIVDRVIQPGQSGIVHARFNTDRFTGEKKATVVLSISKPFFSELQLNVRGYIRSDVVFTPGELQFGDVAEGASGTKELRIDYAGRSDWQIVNATCELPFVEVKAEEVSRQGGRIQYKLLAKISGDAPTGVLQSQVVLHTNDRRLTSVPLPLIAKVQSNVQVSPPQFALGKIKSGQQTAQRLVVKGKKPFKILSIKSDHADVEFKPVEEARAAHMVNLTIAPKAGSSPGVIEGEVLLQTDLRDQPLRLQLTYEVPHDEKPVGIDTAAK